MRMRCNHLNSRGYGRCVLDEGHPPADNGAGVKYLHSYAGRDDALGTLDVYESLPREGEAQNEFLLAPDSVPTGGVTFSEQELRMVRELAAFRGPVVVLPDDASYTYEDSPPRVSDAFDFRLTYYIAGPMTGYPECNYPAFRAAEDILTRTGVKCVTPIADDLAVSDIDKDEKWAKGMKLGIGTLLSCQGIILLKGWPESRGARRELELAIDLGYPVWYYHEYQLTLMSDPR